MNIRLVALLLLPLASALGCSPSEPSESNSLNAVATDYCPQVIEILSRFESTIVFGTEEDGDKTLPELRKSAHELALVAIRAETEGVNLKAPESRWLNDLKNASRAFLTVLNGDADYLNEDEQRNLIANILDDFEDGVLACTPSEA
jgi:hypothetical protein